MKVEFFKHNLDEADIANVADALRGTFLTTGDRVARFERQLAEFAGCAHAVGLTSGTAALHLALVALGVGPGDEVITTPMSFVATANAILTAGATPVFVDVEAETGNLDAELVEAAVTEKTRAVLPVHLYGVMCDMKRISQVARRHGLFVVEDAAHALEASRDGVRPADLSDAAALSFYATKSITSGEGGALLTGDAKLAARLKTLRLHGISKSAAQRHGRPWRHYDMELLGYKYNMSNVQAAMLTGQLARTEKMRRRREEIASTYRSAFAGVDGIDLPEVPAGCLSACHLFTIWVHPDRRDALLDALQQADIGVAVNYRPIHLMKYYRETFSFSEGLFPKTEKIGASTISLPLYPKLTPEEIDYVVSGVIDAL